MSKAMHTPGPWVTLPEEVDKPYIRIRGTRPGGRYKVANVITPVYEGVHEREADETRANARLIAAAPELLEALRAVLPYLTDGEDAGDEATQLAPIARTAIQKAEAQQ